MKKFLESRHWIKMLTRDISFIRLVIIYESYCERYKRDIGWIYSSGFSFLQRKIFYVYRSEEGIVDYTNDFLKVKNRKQFFEEILKRTKLEKKKAEKDIKFCKSKLKLEKKLTHQDLLEIFRILYQALKNLWSLQNFPMALEFSLSNSGENDLILKYKEYLIAIRQQTQYVTVGLEDLIDSVLKKIAKNKKLNENLISFATPSEIVSDRLVKKKLTERKKICLLGFEDNKVFIYSGRKAKDLAKFVIPLEKSLSVKEIKGNPAHQGKVRGIVKVILYRKNLDSLKGKEILVAPMTEAYYTPYLKKVKAIITDEGGITCHAAIISRELKIPCIIGTKIATKVLKDGDLVEVDAKKGVVRILGKS